LSNLQATNTYIGTIYTRLNTCPTSNPIFTLRSNYWSYILI